MYATPTMHPSFLVHLTYPLCLFLQLTFQGNIFIGEGGKVALIDCGQFKALPRTQRVQLAKLILQVDEYQKAESADDANEAKAKLGCLIRDFGVKLMPEHENDDDLAAAVALFLFGDSDRPLPGGYSTSELDEKSPIKLIASFPQEFVLLGRATVLLKGIAKRLDVPFSLAERWSKGCKLTVSAASAPQLPLWGKDVVDDRESGGISAASSSMKQSQQGGGGADKDNNKIQFRQVARLFKAWGKGKARRFIERVIKKLPGGLKAKVLEAELRRMEREDATK